MLNHLLFFLLFETVQPSYNTLIGMLPEQAVVGSLITEQTPIKKGESISPVIEAKSLYSVDLETGTPLLVHDIFTRRQIASIAKLVTAMVILDTHAIDEKVTVSYNAASQDGSRMWLRPGEEITVGNLLAGMLVNSGNDAAVALAEHDTGNESAFVKKMNAKAAKLGLRDTHFSNAKGFDERANYSTAYDTMLFARAALEYALIRKVVAIKTGTVTSSRGGLRHKLESTNELLENPYFSVIGLKTGLTPGAGESFVSLAKMPSGREVLTVMLDSPDRFQETKIVIDWILRNYEFPL